MKPKFLAASLVSRWSAVRAVDIPGLRAGSHSVRRFLQDRQQVQPQGDEATDPHMPKLSRSLVLSVHPRIYLAMLVEYFGQVGFELAELDVGNNRIAITRHSQLAERRCRYVVQLTDDGKGGTLVSFGIERPLLSRFQIEKHVYLFLLTEMAELLKDALRTDPAAKRRYACELQVELDKAA